MALISFTDAKTSSTHHFKQYQQVQVVQMLDSAIYRINHYPADKRKENQLRYWLDSDLSGG